VFLAFFLAVS